MHSERRRKQLLRATHSFEYTSFMSATIADIIRREVFASSQTSRSVAEFRRILYMLHDYNTLVFKCTYHYPISTETKLLLRRYVELESYILYKSKWTSEIEDQVQNRVFKTVMYFLSGSYHATGQSIAEDRKLIFDEALKIFIHFADVSTDRFPAKILRNILNTLGIVNISTNSGRALYVNNPSLKKLKEYLRDSDYGSDDDSVESSEETVMIQSSFKFHNEKKLLEKPLGVKCELNSSNRTGSSSSQSSLSMPINNSSFVRDKTSVVNLFSKSGTELSSVNDLSVQSITHNQQQVTSQIRSRFKSQERSGFTTSLDKIRTMFQSSDFACNEEKCDFDSKPIMDKTNDDFECIPTDFTYILDKRKKNGSIDAFPCTQLNNHSNIIQLTQYRDYDAITRVNELEPLANLTAIPEFSIGIPEQKTSVTDESNIGNMASSSAMNVHSEFLNDSVLSFNQTNNLETIVTNVSIPSDDTYTTLPKSEMSSDVFKVTASLNSNYSKSQVEEFGYSNKHIVHSHSDMNNSRQNIIIVAQEPVKGSEIQGILSSKEKREHYKHNSLEITAQLERQNSSGVIVLSQSFTEQISNDQTLKHQNGDFNKRDTPLINLTDNAGKSFTISENSYENIALTSKVKARNTFNPICEDAIVDETSATTINTQLYVESLQAQKSNANINMSMTGDSSIISRLENTYQHIVNDLTLERKLASNEKRVSINENINKSNNNGSAAVEYTSKTIREIESHILEVGKPDEKSSKSTSFLSEKKTTCDVHKIRINRKIQSVLEETVVSDKILDMHGTCYKALDRKIDQIPKIKSQHDTENIHSGSIVRKINHLHPIKLNSYIGEAELILKKEKDCDNRNDTVLNVNKKLKFNFEVEKKLVDDNLLCEIIGENETNSIVNHPLVSNNTNDASSTIDNKRSTKIVHDLDIYKTEKQNETFNPNFNEEPGSVVSLENLQHDVINDFVVDNEFLSTENQGQESGNQLPLADAKLNFTFQKNVNCFSPKMSKGIIEDSENSIIVDKEFPNVSQREMIDVINNLGASDSVIDDTNMQNKSEERIRMTFSQPEPNDYISTENSSHSSSDVSVDIMTINKGETENTISGQSLGSINTKDGRSLRREQKSEVAFEDMKTLPISDNFSSPNILQHVSKNHQTAFDLYVNTSTIINPIGTSETSNLDENNDLYVEMRLDSDKHEIDSTQGINENQLIVSSKALPKSSIKNENSTDFRSSGQKENDSSCSGSVEASNKIDDNNLMVEVEYQSSITTKVPIFCVKKNENVPVQHPNDYQQKIEHTNVCEKSQSPITENERTFQSTDEMLTRESNVTTIVDKIEVVNSSSEEEVLKVVLDKADSGIREIPECIDTDSNITVNADNTFEIESLSIDHNLSSKKKENIVLDYVTREPNAIEPTFCENISVEMNELQSIEKLKSISEFSSPIQKSKVSIMHITALNEESVLTSVPNEIEKVVDSSTLEAIEFDSDKRDSRKKEITEYVKVDSNITIDTDSSFETESINDDSSSKKEDKTIVDYLMQDSCLIETTFDHNVSSTVNEVTSIEELKPASEFSTPQESAIVTTYVSCLNEKFDLIASRNEIEKVVDSSSQKAVKLGLDMPDLCIKEITECADIDTNTVNSSFETELPSESMDHGSSTRKEDKTIVDYVLQDPNVIKTTFCENVSDGMNKLRSFEELKSVSEFPSPLQELETANTSVSCLNQESGFITSIQEIGQVISSSQKEINTHFDKPALASIRQITECVDVNTNTTIPVDTEFEADSPDAESIDNDAPSKIEDKTIVDHIIQGPNVIESTFCENVSVGLNELRSFAELKSMSELKTPSQKSETVKTYNSLNENSELITSGNEIEKKIDSSSQKAVKFDLDMPDLDIIEITECADIDTNVDPSSFQTKLPSKSNNHDFLLKQENTTIFNYVTKDPHVIETTFCDSNSVETNEPRSNVELKSKSEFPIPSQELEMAKTSASCLNQKTDVIIGLNEIKEALDSSSHEKANIDLDKPDPSENEIIECKVIDTNVTTHIFSVFDKDLPSELIDPSSSKKENVTVDYIMQDPIVIESTVCENISDEMNELGSTAELNLISQFPSCNQEFKTAITSTSCLNQEADVITNVNAIEEIKDLPLEKRLQIDLDNLGSDIIETTVDYVMKEPNIIETISCENVSNGVNELKLILDLKSISEFHNPTLELKTSITPVTCLNQESTLLTGNTFSDDLSSNLLTIEKKHKNKETSDVLPTSPEGVDIEESMLLSCKLTSEDSFEKINKIAMMELNSGTHKSQLDLNLKVINRSDSNEITEIQPLQNTLCNDICFVVHTDSMKDTDILTEDKINQHVSQVTPKQVLHTEFTADSKKIRNVAENNLNIIAKSDTSEPNRLPELDKNIPREKLTSPIHCELVNLLPSDDNFKTSLHYTKVIAESSPVDVNGAPDLSRNQELNAKTPDTNYAFQVNSLPDELKMLADVASNRKHMKVAKGKPKSKTKIIIQNQSQKNFKRNTESYNDEKIVSKSQTAKNLKINDYDIKADRNTIKDENISSHIMNKEKKHPSLIVGKSCIQKSQKPNNTSSQSCTVSNGKRIKTLGELKHFYFSSCENYNLNKSTDQLGQSKKDLEKKCESVETIDTMKDLSCETGISLVQKHSEATTDVSINVLEDTTERINLSFEIKVDNPPVFSEEEEKNEHQTMYLKHKELLEDCKINKKIARTDNEKSLQNNPKENVKVIVEEVFPMEYSEDIAKSIRTQTNPSELSNFHTEFIPYRLGLYNSPTRTASVPSTANNVNLTKENDFNEKRDIFGDKNSEYKCEGSSMDDLNNQRFDSLDRTSSGNNSEVTDIPNFGVAFTSTPIKYITESCKNKSECGGKRKCTFDDFSLSSKNDEQKLLGSTSRKNKRKHSPAKILLDNELNEKAKEINTLSADGAKCDNSGSVEKPHFVHDTISKPKEIRKSIVTSLKSCNSKDTFGSSDYVKRQQELADNNTDIKLSDGNVGNEDISILSNDECDKIISHLPSNQNNQKESKNWEATNHILVAETKEREIYKISSHESCFTICKSVEISSVEKKEISSNETCSNLCDIVEAENAQYKHGYFSNLLLSNDNTVTEKQISNQYQNKECVNEKEKPINMGVHSHLSEEQQFVDKISCDVLETLCVQKTGFTENSGNCMETLVDTVASVIGENSNNICIQDAFKPKLPVDDLSFLIDEAHNSFEGTNFVFSSASEVSRFLADTNSSQISETFDQNSEMKPKEIDISLVNSLFLENFVDGFPFFNDYGCIGSEVTVSSNILADPLVGGQKDTISEEQTEKDREGLSMDDTDGSAKNLTLDATSFNEYILMYGHDNAQAISHQSSLEFEKNDCNHAQINSQKLLEQFQSDNKPPQTDSQQSSFEDERSNHIHSQINSQKVLIADENDHQPLQTSLQNCSTDNEKLAEIADLSVHKISKNKSTENENSNKVMKNVSQVEVTSLNLKSDMSLRSHKGLMLSKSIDSSVMFQNKNDLNKFEPKRTNKRKYSDSSLPTKDSIVNESSINNTKSPMPKKKSSSEKYIVQSKQIQKVANSTVNTRNIKVDNVESSSQLTSTSRQNRFQPINHTPDNVKKTSQREIQKAQYDSMYDKVKSNQKRRAASKNKNYSESNIDDHLSNKANLSEKKKSKGRSGTKHSEQAFGSTDSSSSGYSSRQRTRRSTCQRTSKSDHYQTTSQLLSSNHRLSRTRSDIRTDQYKEKHKDSPKSQNEKKERFIEENKKRELFPRMPFRVGKQGTSSESDYEKDHKWRKKFSKLYPYTTTANMFSKQTPYGT